MKLYLYHEYYGQLAGEGHHIIEGLPSLRLGAPNVTSNRLTEQHATDDIASTIINRFLGELRDASGRMLTDPGYFSAVRFLEKTPKNSLRIPFINKIFPDAFYIFLYREPKENIGSMIDAWQSGGWVTYRGLPGWDAPWCLLLPPNWQKLRGKSVAEIAAFQWASTNKYILDDLSNIPVERWVSINYADLLLKPEKETERICKAVQIPFDNALKARTACELPLSRYTLMPPKPEKWKRHEEDILSVLPFVSPVWERINKMLIKPDHGELS